MWLTLRATLLVLLLCLSARAQTRTLAVYAGPVPGLDEDAGSAMRAELQRLLAPAGLDIYWRNIQERPNGENFELVAVASFDGSCSPAQPVFMPISVSLADTSISDGRILPFFRVDCTRVIQMLGHHEEPMVIGRAVARVIAHEIYHIVAHAKDHHDTGVAKAAFSYRDLTNPRFDFDAWSIARMRPPSAARVPVPADSSAAAR